MPLPRNILLWINTFVLKYCSLQMDVHDKKRHHWVSPTPIYISSIHTYVRMIPEPLSIRECHESFTLVTFSMWSWEERENSIWNKWNRSCPSLSQMFGQAAPSCNAAMRHHKKVDTKQPHCAAGQARALHNFRTYWWSWTVHILSFVWDQHSTRSSYVSGLDLLEWTCSAKSCSACWDHTICTVREKSVCMMPRDYVDLLGDEVSNSSQLLHIYIVYNIYIYIIYNIYIYNL